MYAFSAVLLPLTNTYRLDKGSKFGVKLHWTVTEKFNSGDTLLPTCGGQGEGQSTQCMRFLRYEVQDLLIESLRLRTHYCTILSGLSCKQARGLRVT